MNYQSLQTLSQITITVGIILTALGGYGAYYYGKKADQEKTVYDKILITPSEIIVPAHASRNVPITVTNNYRYPVYMVVVEITVQEGDIDLSKDFIPFGSGLWQSKYVSCQIAQINSGNAVTYNWSIDGSKYNNPSRIKLSVVNYLKEPAPEFTLHGIDSLPKTIKLPKGFVPPMSENK
jgi:hypothetical protein